jgi:hypothetical protein
LCGTNTLDSPGKLTRKPVRAMGTKNRDGRGIRYLMVSAVWRIFVVYELPFTRNNLELIIKM